MEQKLGRILGWNRKTAWEIDWASEASPPLARKIHQLRSARVVAEPHGDGDIFDAGDRDQRPHDLRRGSARPSGHQSEATRLGIDGIIIVRTLPQSPAAKAGLEGAANDGGVVQDVITAANGQPVHSMSDLANILEEVGVGNAVSLQVMRDGRSRSLDVKVTDISQQAQE
jgi:S1-C subfamily serine protease